MEPRYNNRKGYGKKHEPKKEGHDIRLSKALSKLLRHEAASEGVRINPDGYCLLDEVMNYLIYKKGYQGITFAQIKSVVDDNDKKRFELVERINEQQEEKAWYIRATQGHSMKEVSTQELLQKIENPEQYPVVVHGTFTRFWNLIEKEGLRRMNRLHMHFAPGYPKDQGVISGMRTTCDVYIQIDMISAMKDGIHFYISSNNVILTEGIDGVLPTKYFKKVHIKGI